MGSHIGEEAVAFEGFVDGGGTHVSNADDEIGGLTIPPGVGIDANIDEAVQQRGNFVWFYDQVKPRGPWDYKRRSLTYEDFGNFNYGATGAAVGFSEDVLLRMAGWMQVYHSQNTRPEWGIAPPTIERSGTSL